MKTKEIIKVAHDLAKPFRVSKGKDFRLKDVDPNDTLEFTKEADKPRAKEALANGVLALAELQDKLYAQDKWAVLLIFQAMDAAGKDGAIKHVMSGVNPQGCQVFSFKSPSAEDLDHDYLWRCMKCLPNQNDLTRQTPVCRRSTPVLSLDKMRTGSRPCPRQVSQLSYLKDSSTRARYACTLPSSTFMSIFTISAMRRSCSIPAAVSTAFFAASSQDFALVPITSTTL
jgi:hypothetical protein